VEDVVCPHHGTAIHTREALQLGSHAIDSVRGLDLLQQTIHTGLAGLDEFDVLSLYRSKQFSSVATFCEHLTPLLERLQSRCAIIAGDFNIDLLHHSPPTRLSRKLMCRYGFRQLVCVQTHKYGALLDHIWTNLNAENFKITTGVCVTYWSDHSPTWCCIEPR
jgi:endonuclease/exonuclease/phosphatase family metal-dependent hydrolase